MELSELLSLGAIITDNHDNVFNYRRYAYRRNIPEVITRFYITISERRTRRARARMLVVCSRLIFHVENAGNAAKNANGAFCLYYRSYA